MDQNWFFLIEQASDMSKIIFSFIIYTCCLNKTTKTINKLTNEQPRSHFFLTDPLSTEREQLQAITTPFSRYLPENWIFAHFLLFLTICACSWVTPRSHLRTYWQKYYHWVLLQWNFQNESYSKLLWIHFPSICLKIQFLVIFGHFSLVLPAHGWPLDPISAFIHKNVITGCCCNEIYKKKATPGYYNPILPSLAWKFSFWTFLAIFHYLCLLMGNPLIPPPLLLKTLLSLGAVAMISTPFSHHLPENSIFGHFWPFFTNCAYSSAIPWSHLCFHWHKYYERMLL